MYNHPWCCHPECEDLATWHIAYGPGLDDYTHSCDSHVGLLLEPGVENVVVPIEMVIEIPAPPDVAALDLSVL